MSDRLAVIGTWDFPKTRGVPALTVCARDPESGILTPLTTALDGVSVGALHFDETRGVLYCVDEATAPAGGPAGAGGSVIALSLSATGDLTEIGRCPSYGSLPSYVVPDVAGRFLLVTNHTASVPITTIDGDAERGFRVVPRYDTATTVLLTLDAAGAPTGAADVVVHTGEPGPLPGQTHPRPHSVVRSPSGAFFVVCDKGADAVLTLRLDAGRGRLVVIDTVATVPGSSPRYSVFHPSDPYLFVNCESAPLVTSYRYAEDGRLTPASTVAVLPDERLRPGVRQSDLRLHPDGTVLYSLIRGDDSVAVLDVGDAGEIRLRGVVPAGGRGPRGCAITRDGRFLHIACADTDEVVVWRLDAGGGLAEVVQRIPIVSPGAIALGSR